MSMFKIPLQRLPSQEASFRAGGHGWRIRLVAVGERMAADAWCDDELVLRGVRCLAGVPLPPYAYQQRGGGRFLFLTTGGREPWWEDFGGDCELLWVAE